MTIRNAIAVPALVFLACVAIALPVTAQERLGYEEASNWLTENAQSPQRGQILLQAIRTAPATAAVDALLAEHIESVIDPALRAAIFHEAGMAHEVVNDFGRASEFYAQALALDATRWDSAVRRSALAIETGDIPEALLLLSTVISRADRRGQQRRAAILRARAWLVTGETERAFLHLESLASSDADDALIEPELLLLLYEAAVGMGDEERAAYAAERMAEVAPTAPERDLMQPGGAAVTYYPTPSRLLGTIEYERLLPNTDPNAVVQPTTTAPSDSTALNGSAAADTAESQSRESMEVFGVQTGSFRDEENARFMARDIEALGFPTVVRQVMTDSGAFYRVIVPLTNTPTSSNTVNDAQDFVVRLKERGIEGFLIFNP